MTDTAAIAETPGRLPLLRAAWVVARRDFTAVLFSRAFIFFLLGPLFPVLIAALAGGIGSHVREEVAVERIGVAMSAQDMRAILMAHEELRARIGPAIPELAALQPVPPGEPYDPQRELSSNDIGLAAIVSGSLDEPHLTATPERVERWQGLVALMAANASQTDLPELPQVAVTRVRTSGATVNRGRLQTAQGAQLLLFLLTMLLAGMVLSNLVEEKGNKVIEILAAAIPMDAVFLGKLFAMLGVSLVGITVWGATGGGVLLAGGRSLAEYANPGVGWPMFLALFVIYFAMAYLLLGSIFLAVGSLAATVREVQTLSMPVTMAQVLVFFLASLAAFSQDTWLEWIAIGFPLSSPFTMLARAATTETLWPHAAALAYQAMWVAIFIKLGAALFRKKVMKSGPQGVRKSVWKRVLPPFRNGSAEGA